MKMKLYIFIYIFCLLLSPVLKAEDLYKHRIEGKVTHDYLSPNDTYGSRTAVFADYFETLFPGFTYFGELGMFTRQEGQAVLAAVGAYKDWSKYFYTYSSFSAGTNSEFLPEYRIDNDFNIKMGKLQNIVGTIGASFIKYHDVHDDTSLSAGVTFYSGKVITGYRIFRNISNPGSVISHSHLLDIGYGQEGKQWTYLVFLTGGQGYVAAYIGPNEKVEQDVFSVSLKHRKWLNKNYGFLGELSYLKLIDSYDCYGFSIGCFREF